MHHTHCPQRHGPYFYASAHERAVEGGAQHAYSRDGKVPVKLDEGWEIAPGDECDREVCWQHKWSSHALVFADGDIAATCICLSGSGSYGREHAERMSRNSRSYPVFKPFLVRQGAVVGATEETYDVLLRRLS